MVHVPDFVPGPVNAQSWSGNSLQLYNCYINAFIAATDGVMTNIPAAVSGSFPAGFVGLPGGAATLAAAPLPATIAFSFMGPSHGWDNTEAAWIAMEAIQDASQGRPGGFIAGSPLTQAIVNRVRARITRITLCLSYSPPSGTRAQTRGLNRAWR